MSKSVDTTFQLPNQILDLPEIKGLIKKALKEDIGSGDLTTALTVKKGTVVRAGLFAKDNLLLAGSEIFSQVFKFLAPGISLKWFFSEGEWIKKNTLLAEITGDAQAILKGERVALNFLQHLCGIASFTNEIVKKIKRYKVKILDTRKTLPGLRLLEKYAVKIGGGYNHRFGLFDGILIKENHIKIAGGIKAAIRRVKGRVPVSIRVEVEVQNLKEVKEALEEGVERLLLDNMDLKSIRKAVALTKKRALLEVSGRINKEIVVKVAKTGIDFISIGALTHSAPARDLSLKILEVIKQG